MGLTETFVVIFIIWKIVAIFDIIMIFSTGIYYILLLNWAECVIFKYKIYTQSLDPIPIRKNCTNVVCR